MSKEDRKHIKGQANQHHLIDIDENLKLNQEQYSSEKWIDLLIEKEKTKQLEIVETERTKQSLANKEAENEKTKQVEIEGREKTKQEEERTKQVEIEGRDKIKQEEERTKQGRDKIRLEDERTKQAEANRNAAIANQKPKVKCEFKTYQSGLSTSRVQQSQSSKQFKFMQKINGLFWGPYFYYTSLVQQPSIYEGLYPVKISQTKIKQD